MPALTVPQALDLALEHHRAGRLPEAETLYRQILAVEPQHGEALHHLGVIAFQVGRCELALEMFERALPRLGEDAALRCNLGNALRGLGRHEEAVAAYREALRLDPALAAAHRNLGVALAELGRTKEACAAYRCALELQSDDAGCWSNLGAALGELGRANEAVAAHRQAITLRPDFAKAHNNLGNALKDAGLVAEAVAAYREALRIEPGYARAHSNLLLALHYLPETDAAALFAEHRRWDEIHARPLAAEIVPHPNDRDPKRRLRIGYVSPNFRQHSVAYFLEDLLAHHDPAAVEVFCYSDVHQADAVTARLQRAAHHWRTIAALSDAQAAELIRADHIDLLVDLAGHTAGNRLLLFARKPAPVQVTWLGYSDTTGLSAMDWRLTDPHADPPGATEHLHTERLWRLPDTFACFRPDEASPPVGPLPWAKRGHVTFASFHTLAKLNEPLLELWSAILLRVPDARLLLVASGLDEPARFRDFFAARDVASERLEFRGRQSLASYLALHHEVDVLLDSHPYSGHTTACHALWMGVPVVTRAGDRHCARMVASVLTNIGLPECIARTPEDYVRLATELATDHARVAELRRTLRERLAASPLLDAPRFARHVEAAYRNLGAPPSSRGNR